MSMDKDGALWTEVFNQRAAILTFFGALGGSVRAAVLKTSWHEGFRVVFVGGAVAFGIGVLGPVIMRPWIGDLPDGMQGAMGTLTAASFLIGLVAVTLVERVIAGKPIMDDSKPSPSVRKEQADPNQGELFDMNPDQGEDSR